MNNLIPQEDRDDQHYSHSEKLASFENRWRYAVFPAMIAFIMLSAFGFYLIWGMLVRMQALSEDIDRMTEVMVATMPVMEKAVGTMASRMEWVGEDLDVMAKDVNALSTTIATVMPSMEQRINEMALNINNMSHSTAAMASTTDSMSRNMWDMNRNISKPMSFMSDMMPWQRNTSMPPPAQSRYTWPAAYQYRPTQTAAASAVPTQYTQGREAPANNPEGPRNLISEQEFPVQPAVN